MDANFIRERISALRVRKNVSEYKMSLDLGHGKGYIQAISSGRALPSLGEFLYICEYLGVTPKEFFDTETSEPQLVRQLYDLSCGLSEADLQALVGMAQRLTEK